MGQMRMWPGHVVGWNEGVWEVQGAWGWGAEKRGVESCGQLRKTAEGCVWLYSCGTSVTWAEGQEGVLGTESEGRKRLHFVCAT